MENGLRRICIQFLKLSSSMETPRFFLSQIIKEEIHFDADNTAIEDNVSQAEESPRPINVEVRPVIDRRSRGRYFRLPSLKCPLCNEERGDHPQLYDHLMSHGNEHDRFQCATCNEWCSGVDELLAHLVEHTNKHKCPCCTERFVTKNELYTHMRIHDSGGKRYNCPICKKEFNRPYKLVIHTPVHSPPQHKCDICEKTFFSEKSFNLHVLIHSDIKPFSCDLCEKSYSNKYKLKQHSLDHEDIRRIPCPECEKTFKNTSQLKYHLIIHSGNTPYSCDDCERKFATPGFLRSHKMRSHEDKSSWLQCSKCSWKFKYERELELHNLSHESERKFQCTQCDRKYKHEGSLHKHTKTHVLGKQECPVCKKMLSLGNTIMRDHLKSHQDEREYECDVCGRQFNTKNYLRVHSRVHIEEKQFKCTECPKSCRYRSNLTKHMRIHAKRNELNT